MYYQTLKTNLTTNMAKADKTIIGIDVGGTKIYGAKYDPHTWTELENKKVETKADQGLKSVISQVKEIIDELRDETTVSFGLGLPGYLSHDEKKVYHTPNIKLEEPLDLIPLLDDLDLPFCVENDATLFAYAEAKRNYPKEKHLLGLTFGTGVGGGLIINGEIYRGSQGFAGEFGHMIVDLDTTYEEIASGTAIESHYHKPGEEIDKACHQGDEEACQFVKEIAYKIGVGIANLVQILNPSVVVLGGSVMNHYEEFEHIIKETVKTYTIKKQYENLKIAKYKVQNPGTLGAAMLAKNEMPSIRINK